MESCRPNMYEISIVDVNTGTAVGYSGASLLDITVSLAMIPR